MFDTYLPDLRACFVLNHIWNIDRHGHGGAKGLFPRRNPAVISVFGVIPIQQQTGTRTASWCHCLAKQVDSNDHDRSLRPAGNGELFTVSLCNYFSEAAHILLRNLPLTASTVKSPGSKSKFASSAPVLWRVWNLNPIFFFSLLIASQLWVVQSICDIACTRFSFCYQGFWWVVANCVTTRDDMPESGLHSSCFTATLLWL